MKKVIFASVALCFTLFLFAQTDSDKMNPDKMYQTKQMKQTAYKPFSDGVLMKNGKLMMVKNGKLTVMDHEMAMSNGIKVRPDGTIMKKDGTKIRMKEGQHIDMAGNMKYTKTKKIIKKTTVKETTTTKKKDMYLLPNEKIKNDTLK